MSGRDFQKKRVARRVSSPEVSLKVRGNAKKRTHETRGDHFFADEKIGGGFSEETKGPGQQHLFGRNEKRKKENQGKLLGNEGTREAQGTTGIKGSVRA